MAFNHTLSGILRGHWFIDKAWADAHLPLVLLMLQGKPVSLVERNADEGVDLPYVVDPATMQRYEYFVQTRMGLTFNPNIPENSVGVMPITGPCTKYDGSCGEVGMITRNNWLMGMMKRDNIGSVVEFVDTPGGEAWAAHSYVDTKRKSSKPIISLIDDYAASLGVHFTSSSKETYFSHKRSRIGSIGSYMTLMDVRGYFEKEGIKIHEIYAPQSEDKNRDVRDLFDGNADGKAALQEELRIHVADFIDDVKMGRGDKAAASEKEWSTGKMFYADEGVKLGLADGIKSFEQVISKAAWLAKRNK